MCVNLRLCPRQNIIHPFFIRKVIGQRGAIAWHRNIVFFKKLRIKRLCQRLFAVIERRIENGGLNHQLFGHHLHDGILRDEVCRRFHYRFRRAGRQKQQRQQKTELDYFFHGGKSTNKLKKSGTICSSAFFNTVFQLLAFNTSFGILGNEGGVIRTFFVLVDFYIFLSDGDNAGSVGFASAFLVAGSESANEGNASDDN